MFSIKSMFKLLALPAVFASAASQALPIIQADAFSAGDNKASLQISTGLVWMDYGVNSSKNFYQVVSELNSTYSGWRLATEGEIKNLFGELFSDVENQYHDGNQSLWYGSGINVAAALAIMGTDYSAASSGPNDTYAYGTGWFLSDSNKLNNAYMYTQSYDGSTYYSQSAEICCGDIDYADTFNPDYTGTSTMLVRNSVSVAEPTTLWLLAMGLLGLGFMRRRAAK
jgi:hypothetical protein